jgi:hypothetical protein
VGVHFQNPTVAISCNSACQLLSTQPSRTEDHGSRPPLHMVNLSFWITPEKPHTNAAYLSTIATSPFINDSQGRALLRLKLAHDCSGVRISIWPASTSESLHYPIYHSPNPPITPSSTNAAIRLVCASSLAKVPERHHARCP